MPSVGRQVSGDKKEDALLNSVTVSIIMFLIKFITFTYELISWPIYSLFSSGQPAIDDQGPILARPTNPNDPASPWRCIEALEQETLVETMFPGINTLDDLWRRSLKLYPDKPIMGSRELLSVEMEVQANGRKFKKLSQGKYIWSTYQEIEKRIDGISRGFLYHLRLRPRQDRVIIFSETRAEWQLLAQVCFRTAIPLVTLYATLGDDALVHGILESEVKHVITSDELLDKVIKLLPRMKQVTHIIYLRNPNWERHPVPGDDFSPPSADKLPNNVQLISINAIESLGREYRVQEGDVPMQDVKPKREDLAILMYTSGSTGQPKGVQMSHGNIMTSMAGQASRMGTLTSRDCYIAYLPLAHVLEVCCENVLIGHGIPIGYGSALTLTDDSSKVKRGTKGDVRELRPTLMACVPTICDRIHKSVMEKVNEGGLLGRELFQWALSFRRRRLEHGFPSLLMDRLVFRKIRSVLGGRVRMMISGGAPLSEDAQEFINSCFCRILQGYGLTETCGAATLVGVNNLRGGHVGQPLRSLEIKLRAWEEGGYSPYDKPHPRGEVLIGGGCVAMGYFKQEEKTKEDFLVDARGGRWFATGDIGLFFDDGTLAIIDRKKDLVKLQAGEYVSLGKVELALSACSLVETVCAYADSMENNVVAIVVPKMKALVQLASQVLERDCSKEDYPQLLLNSQVRQAALKQLQEVARQKNLDRTETPIGVYLDKKSWTPDTGLVTDALKLKRRTIQSEFQQEIDAMYNRRST